MPHSFGYRARTRDMFSRDFRKAGLNMNLKTYAKQVKTGDYVDIKANANIHAGMPHKYYHGRTGVVYNVTKRAVGVEVNKIVRNRVLKKRINVRIEHVSQSSCRVDFVKRVKRNEQLKRDAKEKGTTVPIEAIKRIPTQPKKAHTVRPTRGGRTPIVIYPAAYAPNF